MQLFILDYGFTSWERCGLWSQSLFSKHIKQIQQIQQQSPGFLSIFHHICIIKSKLQYLYLCFLRPFKNRSAFPFHSRLRQGHINCTANHVPRHLLNKSWCMEEQAKLNDTVLEQLTFPSLEDAWQNAILPPTLVLLRHP